MLFETDFGVCEFLTKIFKFPAVKDFQIPKEAHTTFFEKFVRPKKMKKKTAQKYQINLLRHVVETSFSSRKRPQGPQITEISISNLFLKFLQPACRRAM